MNKNDSFPVVFKSQKDDGNIYTGRSKQHSKYYPIKTYWETAFSFRFFYHLTTAL